MIALRRDTCLVTPSWPTRRRKHESNQGVVVNSTYGTRSGAHPHFPSERKSTQMPGAHAGDCHLKASKHVATDTSWSRTYGLAPES